MTTFTKKKFLSLTPYQQHRHLASYLRTSYQKQELTLDSYEECLSYLNSKLTKIQNLEELADRYHYHLKEGQLPFSLLPQKDTLYPKQDSIPVSVYLEKIRSAHNVGSILRTAEAMGFFSVYFSESMAFTDNKQVKDTSMGASEWIPCQRIPSLDAIENKPLIALELSHTAYSIYEYTFPETFTLAIGNEEYGCSQSLLDSSCETIYIPMKGRKNSLNVANAFAIVANEINRQRNIHV
jgi:tRNA G18 (ribose-2'-O)-methylase SpoU